GASASGASSTDASATGASAAGAATGAAAGTAASAVAVEAVEVDVAPALATGAGIPELVRFYFETGQAALPADANAQLAALIDWARGTAGARIGISGYHDKQGNAALNAELAKNRARAARQALLAAGVPAERVILVKPQETSGGADDREARRVEVYPAQ
ncbi:MAG: OmpA family protein, partial [Burkholderiaceae bacterium]